MSVNDIMRLMSLLKEISDIVINTEELENIIVFRRDNDGVPIQVPGYYWGMVNGVIFIEIDDPL